jgi:hypothetical protein
MRHGCRCLTRVTTHDHSARQQSEEIPLQTRHPDSITPLKTPCKHGHFPCCQLFVPRTSSGLQKRHLGCVRWLKFVTTGSLSVPHCSLQYVLVPWDPVMVGQKEPLMRNPWVCVENKDIHSTGPWSNIWQLANGLPSPLGCLLGTKQVKTTHPCGWDFPCTVPADLSGDSPGCRNKREVYVGPGTLALNINIHISAALLSGLPGRLPGFCGGVRPPSSDIHCFGFMRLATRLPQPRKELRHFQNPLSKA